MAKTGKKPKVGVAGVAGTCKCLQWEVKKRNTDAANR